MSSTTTRCPRQKSTSLAFHKNTATRQWPCRHPSYSCFPLSSLWCCNKHSPRTILKKKKTPHSKYAKQKTKTEEDKIPHSHNLLCAYKRLLFYKHTLFASSFADVSVLHASLAAGKKKNKIQWTKHSTMYLHLQGIMIQCITIYFFFL